MNKNLKSDFEQVCKSIEQQNLFLNDREWYALDAVRKLLEIQQPVPIAKEEGTKPTDERYLAVSPNGTKLIEGWYKDADGNNFQLTKAATPSVDADLQQLRDWKESAMLVMPDYQAIGKAIGVKLGESVHDKILPWILKQKQQSVDAGKEAQAEWEFLTIIRANYEVTKRGDGSEWKGYNAKSAVLETYEDLIALIEKLPCKRVDAGKETFSLDDINKAIAFGSMLECGATKQTKEEFIKSLNQLNKQK